MSKRSCPALLVALAVSVLACAALSPATASAGAPCAGCIPWWHVTSGARPSHLPRNGSGMIVAVVTNLGDAPADGQASHIEIADTLPAGLVATGIEAAQGPTNVGSCSVGTENVPTCTFSGEMEPYTDIELRIYVQIEHAKNGELNQVSVTGGGATPVTISRPIVVSSEPTPFGVENFEMVNEEVGGAPDTQAASHPFQVTSTFTLNQNPGELSRESGAIATPVALARDLAFKLPPGLVGNPTPFAQCTLAEFLHKGGAICPADTMIGRAIITFTEPDVLGMVTVSVPVFNLEPQVGEPARFGFLVTEFIPVYIDAAVRSGEDYGVTGLINRISQAGELFRSEVSLWGVPGASQHDPERGESLNEKNPPPLFEAPSSCNGPMQTSVAGDSWSEPILSGPLPTLATYEMPAMVGCNRLPFHPSIKVTPDGNAASTPTGLTVDVHNPQEESLNPEGLGEADVKNITVALPPGVAVNPAGGNDLEACSESLAGFRGFAELDPFEPGVSSATFTPSLPDPLLQGVNFCANASKIGTAEIRTPLLPNPIEGAVYLAAQNQNPFGSLIAMYLIAEDPVAGVVIKLAGKVSLCQAAGETIAGMTCGAAGQLVATFENSPPAPFEDAVLHFFGGERAPLATPAQCGQYTTSAAFTPWSAESSDAVAVTVDSSSTFPLVSGPNNAPCPGASLPFNPTLRGGSTNINAGAFTPLTGTFGREDGEQNISQVSFQLPPGLAGLLSDVKLCPEAQANTGTCGPESLIGETTVSAGVGPDPAAVRGGRVYITEKYHGAPFGLSIVDPVKAGPFDLEHDTSNPAQDPACDCVLVRARIEVDPHTAALTITTNSESEGDAIPHFIDGIPVQLRRVNFVTTRSGFQFNPTNCEKMAITGEASTAEGLTRPVEVPFQVTNCAILAFKPKLAVSVTGKTSRLGGAGLSVELTYPNAPFGTQANIKQVKVALPKVLPSRLPTLQKACTAAQFKANPAGCPSASVIGHARAITPLLPVPLEGPAYFVSNGNEAFPNLVIVLQGDNVTIDLVGNTFISGSGVTSTTFKTIPDEPVSSFELQLPQGPYSALTALGNLCRAKKLVMPTEIVGQNGAEIHQNTKIAVTGCAKKRRAVKHRRRRAHSRGARGRRTKA